MKKYYMTGLAAVLFAVTAFYNLRSENMSQIKFDLGKNIIDTARRSGAPSYTTRNVAGLISYGLVDLSLDIPARYTRQGYEIEALPLFAFTLYADTDNNNNLAVETAALQFSKGAVKDHDSAQNFVENLIGQFQKGKWGRHIDELCPAVTGRSSFLNESGQPAKIENCALDPAYRLSKIDWIHMMHRLQKYEWIGDTVLATLTIRYSDDARGITYSINLEFNDFVLKKRREQANLAQELAEGDAKGWKSTIAEKNNVAALKARIKILEENARNRGDMVISR